MVERSGHPWQGPEWDSLLVPLDGSASAERILPTLRALSRSMSPRILLARVAPPGADFQLARVYLDQVAAFLATDGIEADPVAVSGPIPETLIALATEQKISLIAMTTHGRLTSNMLPFGPVAEQIIRTSPVPVLAVPALARDRIDGVSIRTILVVTDGSEAADSIVPVAAEFSRRIGTEVLLLQVTPPEDTGRGEVEVRADAEDHLDRLLVSFENSRVPTDCLIRRGDPTQEILRVLSEKAAGLLALNPRSGGSDVAAGSVGWEILLSADVPLLLPPVRVPQLAGAGRRRLPR